MGKPNPTQSPKRTWQVVETFGAAFSNGGFKNWQICVCLDGIVAVPLGIWPTLAAGIAAGAGYVTISMSHGAAAGVRILVDEGDSGWRRYPLGDLQSVRVKKPFLGFLGAPELYLHRRGERKPDPYGVPKVQIQDLRNYLFTLYESIYSDPGYSVPAQRLSLPPAPGDPAEPVAAPDPAN